jgi:hypothetical protein
VAHAIQNIVLPRRTRSPVAPTLREVSGLNKEGDMDPAFLVPLIPIVAIIAFAAVRIARLRATLPESASSDVSARLEALEHSVHGIQQELAETQDRLDFAERLLSKAREERRIDS